MAKLSSTILVIAFLLLVSFTLTSATARPLHPTSSLLKPQFKEGGEVEKVQVEVVEEECSGKDEECLLRRKTMDAHLDYIYTQHNGSHP